MRAQHFRITYGITIEEYEVLHKKQNGYCAICRQNETAQHHKGKMKRLAIDHCHKTGQVRGLLCVRCNQALGMFNDDLSLLSAAISYLAKSHK